MSNQIVNAAGALLGPGGSPSVSFPGMAQSDLMSVFPTGFGPIGPDSPTPDCGLQAFTSKWVGRNIANVFGVGGVPFALQSSGTIGNNGALSGLTALNTTYSLIYMYFPAGAIYTGSVFGWYPVVMSSTTAGTIYNNPYTGGLPMRPTTLVPFVTTGPGAYTQSSGTGVLGPQFNIPGGVMGLNGGLEFKRVWTNNNSAGNKQLNPGYVNNIIGAGNESATTVVSHDSTTVMRNRGTTGEQIVFVSTTAAPQYLTQDTSKNQLASFTLNIAVATDWIVLESYEITLFAGGTMEFPAPQIITPSSSIIVPQGAQDLGITNNLFYTQPIAEDVSGWSGGTFNNNSGANLYAGYFAKSSPPYPTTDIVNTAIFGRSKVLTMVYDSTKTLQSIATQTQTSQPGNFGYFDASRPFYAEGAYAQDKTGPDMFPALWMLPKERTNSSTLTYLELDIDEGGLGQRPTQPYWGGLTSVINWVNVTTPGNYPQGSSTTWNNSQSGTDWGMNIDRTKVNVFGLSWNPSTNILQWYLNGRKVWSKDMTAQAAAINTLHYYLLVSIQTRGAQVPYNLYVLWLSGWQ